MRVFESNIDVSGIDYGVFCHLVATTEELLIDALLIVPVRLFPTRK